MIAGFAAALGNQARGPLLPEAAQQTNHLTPAKMAGCFVPIELALGQRDQHRVGPNKASGSFGSTAVDPIGSRTAGVGGLPTFAA